LAVKGPSRGWVPSKRNALRAGGNKAEPRVTFYNDCDSLFTQAEKDILQKLRQTKPMLSRSLLSVASDVVPAVRCAALIQCVYPSSRSLSRATTQTGLGGHVSEILWVYCINKDTRQFRATFVGIGKGRHKRECVSL
jgi:hypothetical protein